MDTIRKPFQGLFNIIRFNWHFYVLSLLFVLALQLITVLFPFISSTYYGQLLIFLIVASTLLSLLVSWYIYDRSGLYQFHWLQEMEITAESCMVNINAGFDETTVLLNSRFKPAQLVVFDFYDPEKHTEVSIKRARKAYPLYTGTIHVNTAALPLQNNYADYCFIVLAAHEIRDQEERTAFFRELNRIIKPSGKVIVVEHLRDLPNFLAFNIGFFHFIPKFLWMRTFEHAGFIPTQQIKITPFVNAFILEKHGTAA